MKLVYVFAILIFSAAALSAQDQTDFEEISLPTQINFTVKPSFWKMSGETEYDYNVTYPVILPSGDMVVRSNRSLLEFPLDVKMAGGSVGIMKSNQEKTIWTVELGLYTNVGDPGGLMKDHDWLSLPTYFDGKFSYTESNAKMKMVMFDFEGTALIFDFGGASISILGGYRYQKIEQEIIGFSGWFIDWLFDTNLTQQLQSGYEPAIDYWIIYKGPKFGLSFQKEFSSKVKLNLKSAFTMVWAEDFDDHLLRGFHTFADGTGSGILTGGNIRWDLNDQLSGGQPFVEFQASYDYFSVDATQTFEQYADAGPNEFPVGTSFGGLPHDLKSSQFRFGVNLGLIF